MLLCGCDVQFHRHDQPSSHLLGLEWNRNEKALSSDLCCMHYTFRGYTDRAHAPLSCNVFRDHKANCGNDPLLSINLDCLRDVLLPPQ